MDDAQQRTVGEVLAVGGGRGDNSAAIDAFALSRTGVADPRVCFLPTASGDAHSEIDEFYAAYEGHASTVHLSLFRRSRRHLADTLGAANLIVIGGGNTANLLALWRLHGVDSLVLEAHRRGAVLLGFSAGASALFERSVSDAFGGLSELDDGLGLVPGVFCAHFASPKRPPACRALSGAGWEAGYAVDAGAALHFAGGTLQGALSWQTGAGGYRLHPGGAVPVPALPLGQAPIQSASES